MTKREAETREHMYRVLSSLGLTYDECETLRRCSMTLSRWAERECNGEIERDEQTGKVYAMYYESSKRAYQIADREMGALNRAIVILTDHKLKLYHQTDPRGASLYVLRPGDVKPGEDVSSIYNRGIAVY